MKYAIFIHFMKGLSAIFFFISVFVFMRFTTKPPTAPHIRLTCRLIGMHGVPQRKQRPQMLLLIFDFIFVIALTSIR